jgi:hypothetical protein
VGLILSAGKQVYIQPYAQVQLLMTPTND